MATRTTTSTHRQSVSQSRIRDLQLPVQKLFDLMISDARNIHFQTLADLTSKIAAAAQQIADQNIPHGCPSTTCQEISRKLDKICEIIEAHLERSKWQDLLPPLVAAHVQVDLLIADRATLDRRHHPWVRTFRGARVRA